MDEGLKDLYYIKDQLPFYDLSGFELVIDESDFIAIEKELKAFEIIKEKNVDVFMIKGVENYDSYLRSRPPLNVVDYDGVYHKDQVLTKDEFDLLKEELL